MKVRYIGYGAECDEWRPLKGIIELNSDSCNLDSSTEEAVYPSTSCGCVEWQFCLYKELRDRIKSLLYTNRKGDPVCTIVVPFDKVFLKD